MTSVAAFEVNFMDDVGQTLLNWASAFGTQEMVKKHVNTQRHQNISCFSPGGTAWPSSAQRLILN